MPKIGQQQTTRPWYLSLVRANADSESLTALQSDIDDIAVDLVQHMQHVDDLEDELEIRVEKTQSDITNVEYQIKKMSDRVDGLERRLEGVEGSAEVLSEVSDVGADHGSNVDMSALLVSPQVEENDRVDSAVEAALDTPEAPEAIQTDVLQAIVTFLEMLTNFVKLTQRGKPST
jgi:prophage DNA circulation protein